MVACFVRDEEVVGSNPATPTQKMCTSGPFFGRVLIRFGALIDCRRQREGIKRAQDPTVTIPRRVRDRLWA